MILNPAAGGGRGARARTRLLEALERRGGAVDLRLTEGPGHALELARAAAGAGAERVLAAGGDGTLHEVANGLAGTGVIVGVVPLGSGNDFARLLGLRPGCFEEALDAAFGPRAVELDLGEARARGSPAGELFVNQCGFALEPEVVRRLRPGTRVGGRGRYAAAALRALVAFRPAPLALRMEGVMVTAEPLLLQVGNAPFSGGGFRLTPFADPRDGLLDVCLVERLTWPRLLLALPRALAGAHRGLKGVSFFRGPAYEISSPSGAAPAFHLDGELRQPGWTAVEIRVRPAALRLAVPVGVLP